MDSAETLENWKAAGLIAGIGAAQELRKLSSLPAAAAEVAEHGGVKVLKQLGTAAMQSAIGATVGTLVGKNIGKANNDRENKADKNIATAAPQIFRAGFEEGMRHGLTQTAVKKETA